MLPPKQGGGGAARAATGRRSVLRPTNLATLYVQPRTYSGGAGWGTGSREVESTSRTRSACLRHQVLARARLTNQRTVWGDRPLASAISFTVLPSASNAATPLSAGVRPREMPTCSGSTDTVTHGSTIVTRAATFEPPSGTGGTGLT